MISFAIFFSNPCIKATYRALTLNWLSSKRNLLTLKHICRLQKILMCSSELETLNTTHLPKNTEICVDLHCKVVHAGHKTSNFIRDTGYAPRTILYRMQSNLRQGKGIQKKVHIPASDKIRTKRFLRVLKLPIASNLLQEMAELAKKQKCPKWAFPTKEGSWDEVLLQTTS